MFKVCNYIFGHSFANPFSISCCLFSSKQKYLHLKIYATFLKVDVGQLEGAFIMGLGLWTSEQLKYHPTTGELLTKNTWVFY